MSISFGSLWELGVIIVAIAIAFLTWRTMKFMDTLETTIKHKDQELSEALKKLSQTNDKLNEVLTDLKDISSSIASLVKVLDILGHTLQDLAKNMERKLKSSIRESLREELKELSENSRNQEEVGR